MSKSENDPPEFYIAGLVHAVGPLCGSDPGYWTRLAKTLAAEGALIALPTSRHGPGVHRRYSLDEVRIANVLFRLKAHGVSHSQLSVVARLIRSWLRDEPKFAELWKAATLGEPHELNIAPAFVIADRGFGDEELPLPFIGIDSRDYFRDAEVVFTIRLDRIFREMRTAPLEPKVPPIGLAEAARRTGKDQSTIHRAMQAGRLSYTKDRTGARRIEVAELERVFGVKSIAGRRARTSEAILPAISV